MNELFFKTLTEGINKVVAESIKNLADEHKCDNPDECKKGRELDQQLKKFRANDNFELMEEILKVEDISARKIFSTLYFLLKPYLHTSGS